MQPKQPHDRPQSEEIRALKLYIFFREQDFNLAVKDKNIAQAKREHDLLKAIGVDEFDSIKDKENYESLIMEQALKLEALKSQKQEKRKSEPAFGFLSF